MSSKAAPSPRDFPSLLAFVNSLAAVPEADWSGVLPLLERRRLLKGDLFVRSGENRREVAFLENGLVRRFGWDSEGREFTYGFACEHELVADYDSLISGRPALVNIEAVEESLLVAFSYDAFQAVARENIHWKEVSLRMAERILLWRERRQSILLMKSAKERYADFLASHPRVADRIPRYQIASFIGVSPEALSRIAKAGGRKK
jgi:CRP/FNR family transcriptional regulator, anaerobic regulatory protein